MRWRGAVAAIAVAAFAAAPAAASLQADYDAAQAALDAGRWQDARDKFAALLAKLPLAQAHTAALLGVRTGIAENRLGDPVAAIARLEAALPGLTRPTDGDERVMTLTALGNAEENNADPAAALRAYQAAAAEPGFADHPQAINVRLGLIRAELFSDPDRARADLDAALPALETTFKENKVEIAELYELRGRIELNDHRYAAAQKWFDKALPLVGGMTTKVTVPGQQVRGDLAITAFLAGRPDEARRYLAYTGTGYLPLASLALGDALPPPPCAPLTALRPDDVAVIEVSIADSGRISRASTIYASRRNGPDTAFAAAARDWVWNRDAVTRLPLFYRQALRIEVRCNTSRNSDDADAELFRRDFARWAAAARIEPLGDLPDDPAKATAVLAAEIARRTAAYGAASPQLLPPLRALGHLGTAAERQAAIDRLAPLAAAGGAPHDLVWAFRAQATDPLATDRAAIIGQQHQQSARLTALIADAVTAGDEGGRGIAYLRLRLGLVEERRHNDIAATTAFRGVVAAPTATVPSADPIRLIALLRLASIAAANKDLADAGVLYRATGLDAEQCALVDVQPVATHLGVTSSDFPVDALRWGFDGIVRVGYDIDTAGKPVGVRTVTAVPPFVFDAGTERTAAGFRYRPIYRDGPGVGCSGFSQNVKYTISGVSR